MTQEEKAKAYDIALDKIKRLLGTGSNCSREDLEHVFPELRESEDERIRKEIVLFLREGISYHCPNSVKRQEWANWLEKQGKQILANSAKTCKVEQKPDEEYNITGIHSKHAQGKLGEMIKRKLEMEKQGEQKPEVDQHSLPVSDDSSLPTFDESIYHPCTEKVYEQKHWSEEDEFLCRQIEGILSVCRTKSLLSFDLYKKMLDLLKSLKERVQPQTRQEWSEEDEEMIGNIRRIIEQYALSKSAVDVNGELCEKEFIDADNWLKSLRPQNRWKPSDEQMEALKYSTYCPNEQMSKVLFELYQDLKNL